MYAIIVKMRIYWLKSNLNSMGMCSTYNLFPWIVEKEREYSFGNRETFRMSESNILINVY